MRRPIGANVVPGRQDKTRYQAVMKQFITAFLHRKKQRNSA